jgi:hypothetical protein
MLKIALNWWTEEECRNFVIAVILGVSKIRYLDEDTIIILLVKTDIDEIMGQIGRARRASQMRIGIGDRLRDLWGGIVRVNSTLNAFLLEGFTCIVFHSLQAGRRRGQEHLFDEYFSNCCNNPGERPQTNPELRVYGSKHHSGQGYYILQKGEDGLLWPRPYKQYSIVQYHTHLTV